MRISELARRGGVTTATAKYYLREGLVPPGELTSTTQAQYGEQHVARLRLVRALLGPGSLSISQARDVLGVIDDPGDDMFHALGAAQMATYGAVEDVDPSAALALVERSGWRVDPSSPEIFQLARALDALDDAGFTVPDVVMDGYIAAAERIGHAELEAMPAEPSAALRYAVLGSILTEPLLLVLRRLAEQHASAERFGQAPPRTPAAGN
ncbi:MerR family transcriptional regulator [Microbacterium halotolerans]|uniref:MerR family transcriptional regulator n=1 Tax=Microbacterium halotolerans TaxID=246613 RepID=UPI000E6ACF33|nr:MerR family transcriptional regulator [Microbacterium halotolerans]